MKIYDAGTFEVVHTMDYVSAILSLGISVSVQGFCMCPIIRNIKVITSTRGLCYWVHLFVCVPDYSKSNESL